ncbi:MAG: SMI1/KNR4 family protein [Planctomycetaceae bacterium]
MTDDEVAALIKRAFESASEPDPRFATDDAEQLINHFGDVFPIEFNAMRALLPNYHIPGDHLPADEMIRDYEWETENNPNFTPDFIPFYAVGNGDYLCLSRSAGKISPVLYVAHDDPRVEALHDSFTEYLNDPDWFLLK